MAFDYGSRQIGVAVGSKLSYKPELLEAIGVHQKKADWDQLQDLQQIWQPDAFVVGLAYYADERLSSIGKKAQKFGAFLQRKFHIPCYYVNEYLSSWQAAADIRDQPANRKKINIHSQSAAIILQTFLSQVP